jgi:hypothetical protein
MIGFGGAEFCIEIEGLLPVVAGLARVADRVMTASDAIMGAGLLVPVADLAGHCKGVVVLGAGRPVQARARQGFPETVERCGFGGSVADFTEEGKGLTVESGSLLIAGLSLQDMARVLQRIGFTAPVAELAKDRQRAAEVVFGLLVAVLAA